MDFHNPAGKIFAYFTAHILTGISTAGVNLASGNIGFKLAPTGEATSYLATRNLINSITAGISPILGGLFADYFARRELSMTLTWRSPGGEIVIPTLNFQQWDFFFFFAFLIGLYSIHRLATVKEIGEVEEKVVFHELISEVRRGMRSFTTAGGVYQMTQFPFGVLFHLKKKRNKK